MKTLCLPIIVVVTALSLVSANAMPGLGRETGKFIRKDGLAPKGVRTFEPAKASDSKSKSDSGESVAFVPPIGAQIPPVRPPMGAQITCIPPLRHPSPARAIA